MSVNIPKELAILLVDEVLRKPENAGKNELWFQVIGISDDRVLFEVAHHFRHAWETIEVRPPHDGNVASLRFQGRRQQ